VQKSYSYNEFTNFSKTYLCVSLVLFDLTVRIRDVDDIHCYINGILERSVLDEIVGPTFACIINNQFNNLRYDERYFSEIQNLSIRFTESILF
jgi:hypothetical protein